MIGIKQAKAGFFDRSIVVKAMDRATLRVFSKFGSFVRSTSRKSIVKRNKPSEPGKPPSEHVGTLKRLIFFVYDKLSRGVVIGPTRAASAQANITEQGGRGTAIRGRGARRRKVAATFKARPFMGPAFEKEKKVLPDLWKNSVRK